MHPDYTSRTSSVGCRRISSLGGSRPSQLFARAGHAGGRLQRRAEIQEVCGGRGNPALRHEALAPSCVPCRNQQGHGATARGHFEDGTRFDFSEMLARPLTQLTDANRLHGYR